MGVLEYSETFSVGSLLIISDLAFVYWLVRSPNENRFFVRANNDMPNSTVYLAVAEFA